MSSTSVSGSASMTSPFREMMEIEYETSHYPIFSMEIQSSMHGDILVLRPVGRLDRAGAPDLEELVRTGMEEGVSCLALDFSQTAAISSDGLRSVLGTGIQLRARLGELALAALQPDARGLLVFS